MSRVLHQKTVAYVRQVPTLMRSLSGRQEDLLKEALHIQITLGDEICNLGKKLGLFLGVSGLSTTYMCLVWCVMAKGSGHDSPSTMHVGILI